MQVRDKSGSCAIVMLIIDDDIWFGNTGDSRAVMSSVQGSKFISVTNDHKPSEESEKRRILKGGGQVYQNNNIMLAGPGGPVTQGPVRVIPGRLSVSRTFGDCQAKMEKYGGNPNVIVVDPEIHHVKISDVDHDFVILGCDGIFDRMSTEHCCQEIWSSQYQMFNSETLGSQVTPQGKKNGLNFKQGNQR
mmetsp:Transcript_2479/g.3811  ORF Transcript_2479/g.3811 Transcript_2479/m.3811 type:complete len:190 (+) Transcript_2479:193-762(+)